MDISATEFIKRASSTAEHFGFVTPESFAKDNRIKACKAKLKHSASAADRKCDAMHGLLTGGLSGYTGHKLNALEEPVLFYTIENVPRSNEAALSLQVFGANKSIAEAILIQTARALVRELGYENHTVRVNSIGDRDSVTRYTRELGNFLKRRLDDMPAPARELMKDHVFDALQYLLEKEDELAYRSPNPMEYLSDPSRKHFREIIEYLDMSEIPYEIDPKLIGHHRCYSDALFAIDIHDQDDRPMADAPVYIRGGRYDTFAEQHLDEAVPAAGAVIVCRDKVAPKRVPKASITDNSAVYVVQLGFGPKIKSLLLIDELRQAGIAVQQNLTCDSLSTQLRDAESRGARYTVITGQKEFVEGTVILRDMQARTQEAVPLDQIVSRLKRFNAVEVA